MDPIAALDFFLFFKVNQEIYFFFALKEEISFIRRNNRYYYYQRVYQQPTNYQPTNNFGHSNLWKLIGLEEVKRFILFVNRVLFGATWVADE